MVRISHDEMGCADLIAVETDYQRTALERALPETFGGDLTVRVLAVEDIIVHKLLAQRPQDDADIAAILEAGKPMDVDYLEHWMREWGVADRFTAIRERLALPPTGAAGAGSGAALVRRVTTTADRRDTAVLRPLRNRPAGRREGVVRYQNRKRRRFRELRQEASCRS